MFGFRYSKPCVQICLHGAPINYVQKYLGVMLKANKTYSVDIHHIDQKF